MTTAASSHIKTLKQRDMVLFTVYATLLLDTLAAASMDWKAGIRRLVENMAPELLKQAS